MKTKPNIIDDIWRIFKKESSMEKEKREKRKKTVPKIMKNFPTALGSIDLMETDPKKQR